MPQPKLFHIYVTLPKLVIFTYTKHISRVFSVYCRVHAKLITHWAEWRQTCESDFCLLKFGQSSLIRFEHLCTAAKDAWLFSLSIVHTLQTGGWPSHTEMHLANWELNVLILFLSNLTHSLLLHSAIRKLSIIIIITLKLNTTICWNIFWNQSNAHVKWSQALNEHN